MKRRHISDRERFSIIQNDEEFKHFCLACGRPATDIHECFMGRNRQNSKDYGLCISLCRQHHDEAHRDKYARRFYEQLGKQAFLFKVGDIEEFKAIFGRYYE